MVESVDAMTSVEALKSVYGLLVGGKVLLVISRGKEGCLTETFLLHAMSKCPHDVTQKS